MSANSNLGYTGYLLRKTVQPFSIQKDNTNFNDFREKNMILYINKKVSHTREREGKFLSTYQLQKGINLVVRKTNGTTKNKEANDDQEFLEEEKEADLSQLKRDEQKEMKEPIYREIMQVMNQDEYYDDFAVVSEENKINKGSHSKKDRSDIEQTLNILVANNIEPQKVKELFRDYKKVSLKDKLNDLKSKNVDMAKIQRKIKKDQQKMQDLEDMEKVNKFMGQICSTKNITIGKVLQINEDEIKYSQQNDIIEGVPKIKALEMLAELMEDQEEDNQKNLIKIFKKSQLDNIDTDAARNKFNMTSFKKKNEQTEKLYQKMARNNKKAILNAIKDPVQEPEKFARKRNNVKAPSEKINVFKRLGFPEYQKNEKAKVQQLPLSSSHLKTEQDIYHENLKNIFFNHSSTKSNSTLPTSYTHSNFKKNTSYFVPTSSVSFVSPQNSKNFLIYPFNQSTSIVGSPKRTCSVNSLINSIQMTKSNPKIFDPSDGTKGGIANKQYDSRMYSADTKATGSNSFYNSENQKQKIVQFSTDFRNPSKYKNRSLMKSAVFENSKQFENIEIENKEEQLRNNIQKLKESKQKGKAKELQYTLNRMLAVQNVKDFVGECNESKIGQFKLTQNISSKIKDLENVMDDQIKEANQMQHGELNVEAKVENPNFIEFIKRAEFKRKLISYLVKKVEKKSDVYSQFMSKQFTQNFFQKLSEKDQSGAPEKE